MTLLYASLSQHINQLLKNFVSHFFTVFDLKLQVKSLELTHSHSANKFTSFYIHKDQKKLRSVNGRQLPCVTHRNRLYPRQVIVSNPAQFLNFIC